MKISPSVDRSLNLLRGTVKTQVTAIKPTEGNEKFIASVVVGDEPYEFVFTFSTLTFADESFPSLTHDKEFDYVFSYNRHLAKAITQLIWKVYHHESVEFPLVVGDFGTKEEAIKIMKAFKNR